MSSKIIIASIVATTSEQKQKVTREQPNKRYIYIINATNATTAAAAADSSPPPKKTHKSVNVLCDDSKLGELARERGDCLVPGIGNLLCEAHGKVSQPEFIVPAQRVAKEHRSSPLGRGRDAPDGVASTAKGGNACVWVSGITGDHQP